MGFFPRGAVIQTKEDPASYSSMTSDTVIARANNNCDKMFDCCQQVQSENAKDVRAEKVLWVLVGLSALFIVAEAVGGSLANSLAIITDAGHLLADLISFLISIVAIRMARHPANQRLSFGYHRAEIIGATVSIVILWVFTTVLVLLAIARIVENKMEVDADTMLITAGAGVVFNMIMAAVLQCGATGAHGHSHSGLSHYHDKHDDSQSASHDGYSTRNVNVRAALVHVIGDLVQSVGVLIAAFIIKFTGSAYADPICAFLFSIIVLATTSSVLRDIYYVFMEATPRHIDSSALLADLMKLDNVGDVHDLHVWSLNVDKAALSVHLAIHSADCALETVSAARQMILRSHYIHSVTIQVEPYELDERPMSSCQKCLPV